MTTLKTETIVAGEVAVGANDSSSENDVRSVREKVFYVIRVGEAEESQYRRANERLRGRTVAVRESA